MSIREAEIARNRQQKQRAERRGKEAEARPDAVHRAVVFLIKAAKENNPDLTEEANYHLATLDQELANMEKVNEIEKPAAAGPARSDSDDEQAEVPKARNTAAEIKTSKRFRRA